MDTWEIKAREFVNCNCDFGCPCQFNSKSTHGHCEATSVVIIDKGRFNDIRLDGLSFVYIIKWPGEIAEGKGTRQIIIDEKAGPAQRQAIEKIAKGQSTAPGATVYAVFDTTVSESLPTLFAPIDTAIDVDARKGHAAIKGKVDLRGSPIKNPFNGQDVSVGIHLPHGFEFTYAQIACGSSKTTAGITHELKDSHGHFAYLHMNQDGVIRDEKLVSQT